MKKILLIILMIFTISCKSQKSTTTVDECKVVEMENFDEFDKIYKNIDSTSVYKNIVIEFSKVSTGVLLCKFIPNNKYGSFTIVKEVDNTFICFNNDSSTQKEVKLKKNDIDLISKNIYLTNKKCYYEQCDKFVSNDSYYLMQIKRNGIIVSEYFAHGNLKFKKVDDNANLNALKSVLEVMYRNSFN